MSFLVLLGTLIAERLLLHYQQLRGAEWFARWMEFQQSLPVGQGLRDGMLGLVLLLLPPLLAVLAIQALFGGLLGGLVGILFAAAVLLYCLGPRDLDSEVVQLVEAARQEDRARAEAIAGDLPDAGTGPREITSDHQMAENVLAAAQRRIFGTVLWFLLLGPAGALLYRLARESTLLVVSQARPALEQPSRKLLYLLDWIPSRMLAGLFALAGNFETTVRAWQKSEQDDGDDLQLTRRAGAGALQLDSSLERVEAAPLDSGAVSSAMSLVWRSLVILLALLGLATVAAWLA